jgi:hypothetical protein
MTMKGTAIVCGKHALHDEEVCGPVAEADDKAETEDNAGPVHAHGVGGEAAGVAPQMEVAVGVHAGDGLHIGHDLALEAVDAASLNEPEDGHQERTAPDEYELQNLVENCGA